MKAVILAAGSGTRLRPLTNYLPKCLVKVHGKPLLQYQLEALEIAGIQDCVIVVGYLAEQVKRHFGSRFGNVRITYINNEVYQHTNNIYSLWLARWEMDDDILLLECDLIFDEGLIQDLALSQCPNVAVVDRFDSSMDGTIILAQDGLATSMVLKSQQAADFNYRSTLKTVNIYTLCRETLQQQFLPTLDRYVTQGLTGEFYETVMAQLVAKGDLQLGVHLTGIRKWTEIDTEEDLRQAERMFSSLLVGIYTTTGAKDRK
jgi:NDP-sugar pyrophosphorylase family protein